MNKVLIRPETPEDIDAIDHIHFAAFDQDGEAKLVHALRNDGSLVISFLAVVEDQVVGHIAYSPLTFNQPADPGTVLGLGPMAVSPAFQGQGIGKTLLLESLEACKKIGCPAVIVLGHPEFYAKGGFIPASQFGITPQYDVPDEAFMARELFPGTLKDLTGTAHYHPAFDNV